MGIKWIHILWVAFFVDDLSVLANLFYGLTTKDIIVHRNTWRNPRVGLNLSDLSGMCKKYQCTIAFLQYPFKETSREDIEQVIKELHATGVKVFLLKDGPWESTSYEEDLRVEFPSRVSTFVDLIKSYSQDKKYNG